MNTIKTFCDKHNITENHFLGVDKIEGSLYLSSLTSIPEGFNPTCGGSLDLGSLTSIPEGFNPTCGGYLDLRSLTSIPEGFNPTCGGSLYLGSLKGKQPSYTQYNNEILSWQKGKYISADNMFCEVIHKKGNIYKVKEIGNDKTFYIVSDGKSTHSHGDSLKKAKEDLEFKLISETLKKEPINADTMIDVNRYRLVTGACEFGVKQWMEQNGIKKDKIKASELLPLLEKTNAYGFEKFKKLITFLNNSHN